MKKAKEYKTEYGTISLPMSLINRIKENIRGTGISSVSGYVSFILRQILSSPKSDELFDKKTEEEVKERLKSLGYI
jgi:hypothetical protein